jgi:hypothetical protein
MSNPPRRRPVPGDSDVDMDRITTTSGDSDTGRDVPIILANDDGEAASDGNEDGDYDHDDGSEFVGEALEDDAVDDDDGEGESGLTRVIKRNGRVYVLLPDPVTGIVEEARFEVAPRRSGRLIFSFPPYLDNRERHYLMPDAARQRGFRRRPAYAFKPDMVGFGPRELGNTPMATAQELQTKMRAGHFATPAMIAPAYPQLTTPAQLPQRVWTKLEWTDGTDTWTSKSVWFTAAGGTKNKLLGFWYDCGQNMPELPLPTQTRARQQRAGQDSLGELPDPNARFPPGWEPSQAVDLYPIGQVPIRQHPGTGQTQGTRRTTAQPSTRRATPSSQTQPSTRITPSTAPTRPSTSRTTPQPSTSRTTPQPSTSQTTPQPSTSQTTPHRTRRTPQQEPPAGGSQSRRNGSEASTSHAPPSQPGRQTQSEASTSQASQPQPPSQTRRQRAEGEPAQPSEPRPPTRRGTRSQTTESEASISQAPPRQPEPSTRSRTAESEASASQAPPTPRRGARSQTAESEASASQLPTPRRGARQTAEGEASASQAPPTPRRGARSQTAEGEASASQPPTPRRGAQTAEGEASASQAPPTPRRGARSQTAEGEASTSQAPPSQPGPTQSQTAESEASAPPTPTRRRGETSTRRPVTRSQTINSRDAISEREMRNISEEEV